jgi:sec-independent protein translocase protein TatB
MHINISEILVILLVALLVIKPEKLPQAARTLGKCFKWMRTTSEKIRLEMEKPLDLFSNPIAKETVKKTEDVEP